MRDSEEREFKDLVQYGLKAALDFLIPRKCVVCESTLDPYEKYICNDCLEDLPRTYYWRRKFNPMADRFNALIQEEQVQQSIQQKQQYEAKDYCSHHKTNGQTSKTKSEKTDTLNEVETALEQGWQASAIRIDYVFAAALFFYRAESGYRRIPYQIKYHGDIPAGRFFGQMLGEKIASAEHFADVDTVIPIPLHWTRKWSRGYNQAEIIAREVASALGAELRTDILERCRRTRTQTKLTIEGKAANVQGAFSVRPGIINSVRTTDSNNSLRPITNCPPRPCRNKADAYGPAGPKHLLLVDDVFTTGSTLHACYAALREVFPPSVRISVATLAFVGEA